MATCNHSPLQLLVLAIKIIQFVEVFDGDYLYLLYFVIQMILSP